MQDKVPPGSSTGTRDGDRVEGTFCRLQGNAEFGEAADFSHKKHDASKMKRARGAARCVLYVVALGIPLVPLIASSADRATEICKYPGDIRQPLSVASTVTALGPLSGFSRHKALSCPNPGRDLAVRVRSR